MDRLQPPPRKEDIKMPLDIGAENMGIDTAIIAGSSQVLALPIGASNMPQSMTGLESTNTTVQVNEKAVSDPRQAMAINETLTSKSQQGLQTGKTDKLSFEAKYGLTFENLARVPSTMKPVSGTGKFNRNTVNVFLAFAEDKKHEEVIVKEWLTTCMKEHMIYSSSEGLSWERFKQVLLGGDQVGIILIHGDFLHSAFGVMKGLANQLNRENVQVFRVSLERPLNSDSTSPRNFGRIFPAGQVVLVTEATIFKMAAGTAELIEWFTGKTKVKSNWRLFLRPQPQDYLQDLCETDISKADRSSHERSLILLDSLHTRSSVSPPPTSPYDDEESSSFVLSPLSLPIFSNGDGTSSLVTSNTKKIAERNAKLIEYFHQWAFFQVSKFRRFTAITTTVSNKLRMRNSHVEFLKLAEFDKKHGIRH